MISVLKMKNCLRKSDKEKSVDLSEIPPQEGDGEVKERKELKVLTPNKLLTRLSNIVSTNKSWK